MHLRPRFILLITTLFLPFSFLGAQTFNFAVDSFNVDGNLFGQGNRDGALDFLDDFNDGSVAVPPTSAFSCVAGDVPTEAGGFLLLRRVDVVNNRYTDPQGNTFLVMNCVLGLEQPTHRFQKGAGNSIITASFRADPPAFAQSYGLQLFTVGTNELVNIAIDDGGGATFVTALLQTASLSRVTQRIPVTLTNAQRIHLRLSYDDVTHIVTPSFSIDNGPQIPIPLPQPSTVMTTGNQATASIFGSVLLPSGVNASDKVITNYQVVNVQPAAGRQSYVKYRADLINPGPASGVVTATLTDLDPFSVRIVPGQDVLTFAPVPARSQVTSSNTFTVITDASIPLDVSKLKWTFQTAPALAVANPGPNRTVTIGSTVTLDGSNSTSTGGAGTLAYDWKFTERPPGTRAVLQFATSATPTFVADAPGTYVIRLTVSDGLTSSSSSVTVTAQSVPTLVTVFSNFGQNDTYTTNSAWQIGGPPDGSDGFNTGYAAAFRPSQTVSLSTITVVLNHRWADNTFIISLYSDDAANNSPDTLIESFTLNNQVSDAFSGTLLTLNSILHPTLVAGAQYWISVRVPSRLEGGGWLSSLTDQNSGYWASYSVCCAGGPGWNRGFLLPPGFTRGVFAVKGTL